MKFGTGTITTLKHGANQASKLMLGASEVWVNFSAQWSGNSYCSGDEIGIEVSGSLYRAVGDRQQTDGVGVWLSANTDGTLSIGSSIGLNGIYNFAIVVEAGNIIKSQADAIGTITFSVENGFSGYSDTYPTDLEASGGLLRANHLGSALGNWISLT